jgi:hypothetical protein
MLPERKPRPRLHTPAPARYTKLTICLQPAHCPNMAMSPIGGFMEREASRFIVRLLGLTVVFVFFLMFSSALSSTKIVYI